MPWLVLRLLALKSWLSSRTRHLTTKPVRVGIFVFILSLLLHPTPANAAPLWVEDLVQGFAYVLYTFAAALTQGIVLLIDIMVPIMTYNNFVGNPVVKAGWAIVRDTVNMFFVVILIIIAFGTIFGAERFKWQQQVPRLLIMAIVVNFSKTLCGIMIDFGQVIMLTFANALREIAAGNFIQLLGLNKIYQVSQASSAIEGVTSATAQGTSQAFDFFGSAILSVALTLWVLATLVILVVILLFRIIGLWVLVVLAPLAWFMKGAKGIIDSKAYEEWWQEFKCLVGIGPVLTFFLWLTLAVAGAGNIAANSGFNVSADSNNADFTASWLEPNNFLSFLIGMALLYAGFKAASQFCSAGISGGKIGSLLKQPAALARTAVGLTAKGGGFTARLGARGVAAIPRTASAASRYLPPGLRNFPYSGRYNPLNPNARAGAAGFVGNVFGDNAVGRYFKGKKADIELGANAKKFEGVNKEKEAMKDKSRDWKKGQLESMLKSPPRTQAGQDMMTALFEEAMADSRLQKELGPEGMKKLWASQGSKYEDMAKDNTAKTADLEGFKKKYAHVTGAVDKLKYADDMKGLTAEAWEDSSIQEKAGRMATTFKKDGKTLTALEAAREGHYGEDARKAAIKGTDATKLDIGSQMENQFAEALRLKDQASAEKVLVHLESKYTDTATSKEDRERMALSMDRMRAAAAQMGKGGNTVANDLLASFDTKRKGMETTAGFGLPPVPKAGENVDEFVDKNFSQSSGERIDAAIRGVDDEKTPTDNAVAQLETELQSLQGKGKEIADKQKQIAEVRRQIQKAVDQAVTKARQPLVILEAELAAAKDRRDKGIGTEAQVTAAQARLDNAHANLARVQTAGQSQLTNSDEIKNLETQVQDMIDKAGGQAELQKVNEKSRKYRELKEQAERLKQTRDRLAAEKAKRTA